MFLISNICGVIKLQIFEATVNIVILGINRIAVYIVSTKWKNVNRNSKTPSHSIEQQYKEMDNKGFTLDLVWKA